MGGLAVKNAYTRRYHKEEYFDLCNEVYYKIHKYNWVGKILPAYREKESFGDMDVLILHDGRINDPKQWINNVFSPTQIVHNGNVYSFDYKELQIDFIITPLRNWDSSYVFFSWNDLGNFIGKISHKFGLKWGFSGLQYVYRSSDDSRVLGEITLTKDPEIALPFLGFDFDKWKIGFNTKEDIFEYIIQSKYFNPNIFKFENLSALHKKRNLRRKMYHEFLDYLIIYYPHITGYPFEKDKTKYFNKIENEFPGFLNKIDIFKEKEEKRLIIKNKFNGHLIMKKYAIFGKELGAVISEFKSLFEDFNDYIYYSDSNLIWKDFDNFIKKRWKPKK